MASVAFEGPIYRYGSDGLLGMKKIWRQCHAVLLDDSRFFVFKNRNRRTKLYEVNLSENVLWLAFGKDAEKYEPPKPDQSSYLIERNYLIAIPRNKDREMVGWFAADSQQQFQDWIRAMALSVKSTSKPPVLGGRRYERSPLQERIKHIFNLGDDAERWEIYWLAGSIGESGSDFSRPPTPASTPMLVRRCFDSPPRAIVCPGDNVPSSPSTLRRRQSNTSSQSSFSPVLNASTQSLSRAISPQSVASRLSPPRAISPQFITPRQSPPRAIPPQSIRSTQSPLRAISPQSFISRQSPPRPISPQFITPRQSPPRAISPIDNLRVTISPTLNRRAVVANGAVTYLSTGNNLQENFNHNGTLQCRNGRVPKTTYTTTITVTATGTNRKPPLAPKREITVATPSRNENINAALLPYTHSPDDRIYNREVGSRTLPHDKVTNGSVVAYNAPNALRYQMSPNGEYKEIISRETNWSNGCLAGKSVKSMELTARRLNKI